jgi:hypothetical protein
VPKRSTIALLLAGGIFLWGCSKTADTHPATRIFGSPPVIQSVDLSKAPGTGVAVCDYAPVLKGFLCENGVDPAATFPNFPQILITANYSESKFQIKVTDPDSTAAQTDILLVTASYLQNSTPPQTEVSLVIFDDGSQNQFTITQGGVLLEDCPMPPNTCVPPVGCGKKTYTLTSNDLVAGDGIYTRGFAIISNGSVIMTSPVGVTPNSPDYARNCVANVKHQFPAIVDLPLNTQIPFKIEAVDKEGNLTTWPTKPTSDFSRTSFSCASNPPGDDCVCCQLLSNNPSVECKGKQGLVGAPGSGFEAGLCIAIYGS